MLFLEQFRDDRGNTAVWAGRDPKWLCRVEVGDPVVINQVRNRNLVDVSS